MLWLDGDESGHVVEHSVTLSWNRTWLPYADRSSALWSYGRFFFLCQRATMWARMTLSNDSSAQVYLKGRQRLGLSQETMWSPSRCVPVHRQKLSFVSEPAEPFQTWDVLCLFTHLVPIIESSNFPKRQSEMLGTGMTAYIPAVHSFVLWHSLVIQPVLKCPDG